MCGRFGWFHSHAALTESLNGVGICTVDDTFGAWQRFNVAPTANAQIVVPVADDRSRPTGLRSDGDLRVQATFARWGLIPAWVRDPASFRASTFNARADGVADKPVFRDAFAHGRCLVPVSAFYEWRKSTGGDAARSTSPGRSEGDADRDAGATPVQGALFEGVDPGPPTDRRRKASGSEALRSTSARATSVRSSAARSSAARAPAARSQPVMIRRTDGAPIWLAGLHVTGRQPSFTIVTTSANPFLAGVHARQPVILEPERLRAWIDARTPRDLLDLLMQPSDPHVLEVVPIGPTIGQASREGRELIEPTGPTERWHGADARPPANA